MMLVIAPIAAACSSDEPDPSPEPTPTPTRTVVVYMAANNNLGSSGYDRMDIEEMKKAAFDGAIPEGSHLIVYHARRQNDPELHEITAEGSTRLKYYEGGYRDGLTLTPERMREVLTDVEALAPADSYGLVLWSHGTGWVETDDSRSASSSRYDDLIAPLSFGDDYGYEMKVTSLAKALEGRRFDFIYFDCCLMGSIEVAYELRHVTPVIVASPTELQVYGMRYDLNVPVFFKEKPDMTEAARNTFTYYSTAEDMAHACSMVVIDTEALEPLAEATRAIMATGATPASSYSPISFYRTYTNAIVDMTHYISHLCAEEPELLADWQRAYDKAILYKAATESYGRYDLTNFGGLACAMLAKPTDADRYGYRNQAWWVDVVSLNPTLNPQQ
ncbi:MAG: clostripain-related cysteine peptidase [Pseudoflavonifractor sp.]|nr:clostripain-related cysteine peptidase [Pseudoflavonifractor sp.]